MITLYDLSAKEPIKTWCQNIWIIRYILNLKKLPYKTIYIEFSDIASVLKEVNVPPVNNFGYTVPAIIDDTTGATISGPFGIAEYLDAQYPETPKAFPLGSIALQAVFSTRFNQRRLYPLFVPQTANILNPISAESFQRRIESSKLSKIPPVGEECERVWKMAECMLDWLKRLYDESGGPFFMGEIPSFADFILGGLFEQIRIVGDWDRFKGLNAGRWERLLLDLEKYASTEK